MLAQALSDRDSWIDERRADSALVQAAAALSETSGRLRMAGEDAQAVPWRSLGWFAGSVSRTVSSGSSALCARERVAARAHARWRRRPQTLAPSAAPREGAGGGGGRGGRFGRGRRAASAAAISPGGGGAGGRAGRSPTAGRRAARAG